MSLFGNLKSDGLEETSDRLGGYSPFDTDIYTGKVKMAYADKSDGGAQNVNLVIDIGGKEYRETVYVTNKKGENFFINKDDKTKKVPLPGFTIIDDLCLCTTEKPLSDQEVEDKVVKIYDYEARKELPKSVPVLVEVIGKTVSLAIVRVLENKQAKNSSGVYEPTAETREINTITKVFHTESKMTMVEARNGEEVGKFWDSWLERNKGQVADKRTIKDGQAGAPKGAKAGGPPTQTAAPAPARQSLFGKKS